MQVVLVPAPDIQGQKMAPYFPLGVLSLHQVLTNAGHHCTIYYPGQGDSRNTNTNTALDRWAADIVATGPDWVGFSTMCNSYPLVLLLAREVKRHSPQTRVVLGGSQASIVAEESMAAFPWIDYVVRGEAERAVLGLVEVIDGRRDPQSAASLTYRSNGKVLSTPPAPLLPDLDCLAIPDYRAYPHFDEALLGRFLPYEPGRGCPHGCCFCSTSGFWRRQMRQKSPRLLAEQLQMLVRSYGLKNVFLVQDLFAVNEDWLAEFLHAMEAGDEVTWFCYLRPDSLPIEALANMKSAGCRHIYFGIESGSQQVQRRIGKNLDVEQARRTVEAATAYGFRVTTSLVVGFPWETKQDLQETLSLHQHFLSIGAARSQILVVTPLPKTPFTTRYASRLRLAAVPSSFSTGFADLSTTEMDRMIRDYPQVFSSFYYVEPEHVAYEEFVAAAWAGNVLRDLTMGGSLTTQPQGAEKENDLRL